MRTKLFLLAFLMFFSINALAQSLVSADSRAKRLKNFADAQDLATQLTEGLRDDTQKARAIAAWIAFNIERNGFRELQLIYASNDAIPVNPNLPNDILATRIGTPEEFANLYAKLASLAQLEVKVIPGFAGYKIKASEPTRKGYEAAKVLFDTLPVSDYKLQRYIAAWNAVKIDGEWKLLDTYYMIPQKLKGARGVSNERDMRNFLERRERNPKYKAINNARIEEDYFFPQPRDFIKTHFPQDSIWQLIVPPRKWSSFAR